MISILLRSEMEKITIQTLAKFTIVLILTSYFLFEAQTFSYGPEVMVRIMTYE